MQVDKLISQFLGSGQGLDKVKGLAKGAGFGKGAATGGILGLLMGSKKGRKMAGGTLKYAGLAAAGAMAWKAYQNWQQNQSPAQAQPATAADVQELDARFSPNQSGANGESFQLALMRAMIGAAKADGHIDATEQAAIFEQVEEMSLSAAEKALVFDMLSAPSSLHDIAASASGTEQAAELYLASRLVIDPDQAVERAYLEALAHKLNLPSELVAHLEQQAVQGMEQ
ncbi:protein YebE [Oceanisphaera marina]|uniref:Protein YebE n=1 Tax=Oceanisphaera marina TaxID=2017550 RepID=A0ABQ1IPA4_9GAMM|nr:tellurite resistance TerB family protein [Oceanisphaera marina]GGB49119.1 protein YebE [Oceanisphaera marina]